MKFNNYLNDKYLTRINNLLKESQSEFSDPNNIIQPKGKNDMNSFQIFYQRKNYQIAFDTVVSFRGIDINFFKDFLYEHNLYGKVNKKNEIINLNSSFEKNLKCNEKINLLKFAAEAYDDLFDRHKLLVDRNIISKNSLFSDITPVNGYKNPNQQYSSYLNVYLNNFIIFLLQNDIKIKNIVNFKSFMKYFLKYYNFSESEKLINKSNFIRSDKCNHYASGLIVDIANFDHSYDSSKFNIISNDVSFNIFNDLAREYGFVMDRNYPWRLIFDIESPTATKYLKKYNITNTDQLFEKCYYLSEYFDYDNLKINLLNLYNDIVIDKKQIFVSHFEEVNNKICKSTKIINRNFLNIKDFNSEIMEEEFLSFYFYIKCKENNLIKSENEFQQHLKEINLIYSYKGKIEAIEYIINFSKINYNKGSVDFVMNLF